MAHPLTHGDPDCCPNRSAFTLTGPSPILRCWFDKGAPLLAAKPPSWVSPCLTSCCFFLPLDWSSVWCVLALWWTGPHCVCVAVAAFLPGVVRWRHIVDMWVAEGHTARWPRLCGLFVHRPRCGCRPASGMSTPSRCRGPGTQQVSKVVRPSWEQWFLRGCVCQSRSFNPHWGPQMVGEAWEDEGTILRHSFVGLSRCGDGPL